MSSVIYNPFIYFGLNKHFRSEIGLLFSFLPFCRECDEKAQNTSVNGDSFRRSSRFSEVNNNHHVMFINDINDNYNNNYNNVNYLNFNNDRNNSLYDLTLNDSIVNRNLIDTNVL